MNTLNKIINISYNNIGILSFFICIFSLFIGFFFNEDLSGGGTSADFYSTLSYVLELKQNLFAVPKVTVHLPLHYLILSRINIFVQDITYLRVVFLIISINVPILFYFCLRIKFISISKEKALLISSLIMLFPGFRYSAIWANAHITGLIFFLLSIYFFFKSQKVKFSLNKNIFFNLFFMSLATYSRQYYALFFLFYLYFYFNNYKLSYFLFISFFIFILSIPGWIMIYHNPSSLLGIGSVPIFSLALYNSLLVSSSIIIFYLLPLIFTIFFTQKNFFYKKILSLSVMFIFSIFIVSISSIFFDYNFRLGGGVFLKASRYFFSNNLLFYFSSIIGFVAIFYFSYENKYNLAIFFILLFGFSAVSVLQKYYEPMFFMILYLLIHTNLSKLFFDSKYIFISYLYYIFYYFSCLANSFFKFSLLI